MDKSDVEMEDAKKKAQEVENNGRESNESLVKYENGVQAQIEDPNSNSKSGAKSPINSENEDGEQKNASIVDMQSNASDNTENQLNSMSQPEAHDNVVCDDKKRSKFELQVPNNTKGDTDDNIARGAERQNQGKNVNGEEELEGDVLQDKEHTTGAAKDDTKNCNVQLPDTEVHKNDKGEIDEVHQSEKMIYKVNQNGNDKMVDEQEEDCQVKTNPTTAITDSTARSDELIEAKTGVSDTATEKMPEPVTPTFMGNPSSAKAGQQSVEESKNFCKLAKMGDDEDEYEDVDEEGSLEDQAAFMREIESFYRERATEFKPPKFYGHPLNCLKLWRYVIRLGGYDRVTGSKLWRLVGESFNPPKTCTTVSWTFRIFYEKALLEYERHKKQCGELQLPIAPPPDSSGVDNEGNGYQASASGGRARRDSATRAMQGWHDQRLIAYGEDKNVNSMPKREKSLKSITSLKHKRQNEAEHSVKVARMDTSKQLVTTVVDVGPPADWVKINVRESKDCFDVYALVPGLLREEVRVQSDPAGRLVITGQPEQLDNPWGITAFKKIVNLPARIDPLQTSATVSLHGRLHVNVPFAR